MRKAELGLDHRHAARADGDRRAGREQAVGEQPALPAGHRPRRAAGRAWLVAAAIFQPTTACPVSAASSACAA
jgi:hypothetical protein